VTLLLTNINITLFKKAQAKGIITIKLGIFYKLQLDIGRSLEEMMLRYTLSSNILRTFDNIFIFINSKKTLKKFLKVIDIQKSTIIIRYNTENEIFYPFVGVGNWTIISTIKKIIHTYFRNVSNEYYQIYLNEEKKQGIDLNIIFKVKLFKLITLLIFNFKEILNIFKKLKEEQIKNGRKAKSS